jgi:hypothetical protein
VEWEVEFHRDFDPEFDALPEEVQDEIRAHAGLLEQFGPRLGRPRAKADQRFDDHQSRTKRERK